MILKNNIIIYKALKEFYKLLKELILYYIINLMNNQPTNQPINEMKVPEGYKLVKIGRTESQKKAQAKYEAKNK